MTTFPVPALQIDHLMDACVAAAAESLDRGDPEWAEQVYATAASLNLDRLAEHVMSFIAHRALSVNTYLGPFGRAVAAVDGAPEEQLAAIFYWLSRTWDCRWPTSLVVTLLLRVDQLTDVGAELDIEALMDAVDFSLVQPAEHRALCELAASCSRRTSALCALLQKLAILEPSNFGDSPQSPAADDRYGPAQPGEFVAGNLGTEELDNGAGEVECFKGDLCAEHNKLFSGLQNALAAAQFSILHTYEGDEEEDGGAYVCLPAPSLFELADSAC